MDQNVLDLIVHVLSHYVFNIANAQAMLRLATPVVLAALSALITSRAGMLNIAAEGMINLTTFTAVAAAYFLQSTPAGIAVGILTGLVVAAFIALFSLKFRANLIIMGIAINIFAVSVTMFLSRAMFKQAGAFTDPSIIGIPPIRVPILDDIPVLGELFSQHSIITYFVWVLVPLTTVFLYRTKWGLRLRAVGENPHAAETLGINVQGVRLAALLASGFYASLAGIYLSLSHLRMYADRMAAGRGFIGMSANTFGNGEPGPVFFASLLFGLVDAIGWRLHAERVLAPQLVNMLPYIATLLLLALYTMRKLRQARQALERAAQEVEQQRRQKSQPEEA
jgi:simple sugar transport system permease protein